MASADHELTTISNEDLRPHHLPAPDSNWVQLWEFALSFNGYEHWGSFEKCAAIANARQNETLTEL